MRIRPHAQLLRNEEPDQIQDPYAKAQQRNLENSKLVALPPELKLFLLLYLSQEDINSLRASCRDLRDFVRTLPTALNISHDFLDTVRMRGHFPPHVLANNIQGMRIIQSHVSPPQRNVYDPWYVQDLQTFKELVLPILGPKIMKATITLSTWDCIHGVLHPTTEKWPEQLKASAKETFAALSALSNMQELVLNLDIISGWEDGMRKNWEGRFLKDLTSLKKITFMGMRGWNNGTVNEVMRVLPKSLQVLSFAVFPPTAGSDDAVFTVHRIRQALSALPATLEVYNWKAAGGDLHRNGWFNPLPLDEKIIFDSVTLWMRPSCGPPMHVEMTATPEHLEELYLLMCSPQNDSEAQLQKISFLHSCTNLRSLFLLDVSPTQGATPLPLPLLGEVLPSMTQLQELSLDFLEYPFRQDDKAAEFQGLLNALHGLPNLQSLKLLHVASVKEGVLAALLESLPKLRDFHFDGKIEYDDDRFVAWTSIAKALSTTKIQNVHHKAPDGRYATVPFGLTLVSSYFMSHNFMSHNRENRKLLPRLVLDADYGILERLIYTLQEMSLYGHIGEIVLQEANKRITIAHKVDGFHFTLNYGAGNAFYVRALLSNLPNIRSIYFRDPFCESTCFWNPEGFPYLPELETLCIDSTYGLNHYDLNILFSQMPNLKEVTMRNVWHICYFSWLTKLPKLEILKLGENCISGVHWDCAAALSSLKNLKELDISGNPFNDDSVSVMLALQELPKLTRLNMEGTGLTDSAVDLFLSKEFDPLRLRLHDVHMIAGNALSEESQKLLCRDISLRSSIENAATNRLSVWL